MAARTRPRIASNVLGVVGELPTGRVTTYGAIAAELNAASRQVAAVMARLTPEESACVPWHRVVGAGGMLRTSGRTRVRQAALLRSEGIEVSSTGRIRCFEQYRYSFE